MIDDKTKTALNDAGSRLSEILPNFYGKIVFNFYNGNYVNANIEQSIQKDNRNKRSEK